MLDPRELFEVDADVPALSRPVLVEALHGFIDAGAAKRLATDHLLESLESRVIATFDADQLFDYRARRPQMLFVEDHWESYDEPRLVVHLVQDAAGTPFLLLTGPEPDVQWERFALAVQLLVERLDVSLTMGLGAIPMAVPHTRSLGVILHGSPRHVAGQQPWITTVHVPASAGHLLEYRLSQAGHDAMGFAVHVPHYLAQTEYPAAAVRMLEAVEKSAGLRIPTDALQEQAKATSDAVDAQVAQSPEIAEVVRQLETQYDLILSSAALPTADELGAELERFLAQQGESREE